MTDIVAHTGHMDTCPFGEVVKGTVSDTLCKTCQTNGPIHEPEKVPATSAIGVIIDLVYEWQRTLRLQNWTIRVAEGYNDQLNDAYVRKDQQERVATLFINPMANSRQRERLVVHELLHLLLDDLQSIAQNDRSIPIMHMADEQVERIINTLSTAFTGVEWEPINQGVRRNHEFDD